MHVLRSFTEKKLTVLMFVICVIYITGNVPQLAIMMFQDESKEFNVQFQVRPASCPWGRFAHDRSIAASATASRC